MSTLVCRRRGCGAILDVEVVGSLGMLRESCPRCARNKRGLCRDCPRPLARPRHMRCLVCRRAAQLAAQRRCDAQRQADPAMRRARLDRMRLQRARPEVRERRRLECKAWAARNPRDETDRAIARARYRLRYYQDPAFRAHESKRQVRWRQARRARRAQELRDYIQREIDVLAPIIDAMLERVA